MADKPKRRSSQKRPAAKPAAQPVAKPVPGKKPARRPTAASKKPVRKAPKAAAGDPPAVAPTVMVSKGAVAKAVAAKKGAAPKKGAPPKQKGGPKKRPSASKGTAAPPKEDLRASRGGKRRKGGDDGGGGGGRRGGRDFFKPEGKTLAFKFAIAVAVTIFGLMAIFSMIIFGIAKSAIETQIEEDGVIAVSLAAKLAEEYHVVRRIVYYRYKAKWEEMSENEKNNLDDDEKTDRRQDYKKFASEWSRLKDRYTRHVKEMKNFPVEGGGVVAFDRVLLVAILGRTSGSAGTSAILRSNDFSSFEPANRIWRLGGEKTKIRIGRGKLKGRPYWLFTRPCYDQFSGKNAPHPDKWTANVFLNASSIAAAQTRLQIQIILWLLVVVAGGAGVTLFVARKVTAPVNILIDDIDAVASGDLEHRTVPHSKDEIGVIARAVNAMTESLLVAREREVDAQAREHELTIATEIQANLLPKKIPRMTGYDIDAFYQPSKEVGGDYYDFLEIDENHLGMIVADVSGKGIPGSMVMTMGRAIIRMEGLRNLSPADTFKVANKMIAADIRRGMFITAIYGILDIPNKTLLVASAGHNPMVIWRKESNAIQLVNPNGIALGFDRGPIFDRTIKEQMVKLNSGDRVVMYTDGIPESMNPKHEEFGDKRFYQLCQKVANRNSNQFTNIVVAKIREHQAEGEQHDDITILTLSVE